MRSANAWIGWLAVAVTLQMAAVIGSGGITSAQMPCPTGSGCMPPTMCVDNVCMECPAGTSYTPPADETVDGTCTPCESPLYQDETGQTTCKTRTCAQGRRFNYIDAETRPTCPQCQAGKFQSASDHTMATCTSCNMGEGFQDQRGQTSCKNTTTCDPGQHITMDPTPTTDRKCGPCEDGTFTSMPNIQECKAFKDCEDGTFMLSAPTITSDRVCMDCQEGHFSMRTNVDECTQCRTGTYQDETGQSGCKECVNSYQPASGQSGCKDWRTCDSGQKWIAGTAKTDALCADCDDGTYQDAEEHQEKCKTWTVCGEGYRVTRTPNSMRDRTCMPCDKGTYQDKTNKDVCKPCEAGTHQPSTGQGSCLACEEGKFQPNEGQEACMTYSMCGEGQLFKAGTAIEDRTCEDCPMGTFQNKDSHIATACKTCDTGKYQLDTGQSSCMHCAECAVGFTEQVACTPTSNRECADVTDPVIMLVRGDDETTPTSTEDNTYTVEAGIAFVPPIASATDTAAGDVMLVEPTQMEINAIDTSVESSNQMLTYTATDAAGNTATRTITIVVDDTTGPAITFSPATLFLEAGDSVMRSNYTQGVTILDKVDGVLSNELLVIGSSNVKVNKLGEYTITYTLSEADSAGNEAEATTRTVIVRDTLPPVITVNFPDHEVMEDNVVVHEAATDLTIPTGSVADTFDQSLRNSDIQLTEAPEFTSVANDSTRFQLTYSVSDASGNTATETFIVEIRDTTAPTITITDATSVSHEAGTMYRDMGFTATDALEDALGRDIQTTTINGVNSSPPSVPADFTVDYEACDAAGNCATAARQVRVDDTTPPAITLNGNATLVVEAGKTFSDIDPGVTLSDLYYDNADLTLTVDEGGYTGRPASTPATFIVTYAVEDPSGNRDSIERTVTVVDTTPPDLQLNGDAEVVVGDGKVWREPGVARAQDILDGDLLGNVTVTIQLVEAGPVEQQQCEASSAQDFVPPLTPRVWNAPASDAVTSDAPGGTVYGIRYAVADAAGNEAVRERVVLVEDNSTPTLSVLGAEVQTLEYTGSGISTYVESDGGAVSSDAHDGDLSGSICVGVVADTAAATGVLAPSSVEPTARAAIASVEEQQQQQVMVAAGMAMNGSDASMPNHTVSFNTLDSAVASAEVGTVYVVQYRVHDRAGRAPAPVYRAVVVVDTTPPELTLSGEAEVRVPFATRYDEPGYSAVDTHDGDVTGAVIVSGADAIDVHDAGAYNVTYRVADANGNEAAVSRRVVVEARPRPEALEGLVVELVLAGTADELFNSDEQELEELLEATLGVDFVVVFLFYNKRDGRPSTGATRRDLDARADAVLSSDASSAASSSSSSSSSGPSGAHGGGRGGRTGRGLLAKDQTVVEFGVRNSTDHSSFVPAAAIVEQLDGASVGNAQVVSAGTFEAQEKSGGSGLSGGAVAAIVIVVLIICGILVALYLRHNGLPPFNNDDRGFKSSNSSSKDLTSSFEVRGGTGTGNGPFYNGHAGSEDLYSDPRATSEACFSANDTEVHRFAQNRASVRVDLGSGSTPGESVVDEAGQENEYEDTSALGPPPSMQLQESGDTYDLPKSAPSKGRQLLDDDDDGTYDLPKSAPSKGRQPVDDDDDGMYDLPKSAPSKGRQPVDDDDDGTYDLPKSAPSKGRRATADDDDDGTYDLPKKHSIKRTGVASSMPTGLPVESNTYEAVDSNPFGLSSSGAATMSSSSGPWRQPSLAAAAQAGVVDNGATLETTRSGTLTSREQLEHPSRFVLGHDHHRRSTVREDEVPGLGTNPVYLDAASQPGFVGFKKRGEVEEMLRSKPSGTYVWRLSKNTAGAVLSVRGRNIVEHHVFQRDTKSTEGAILMNNKPLSIECETLEEVVELLQASREFSTVTLTNPAVQSAPANSEV